MLEKYRKLVEQALERLIGDRVPLEPNAITLLALLISIFALLTAYYSVDPMITAGVITLSGVFDSLDGYVARKKNIVTKFGAFLDSTTDRVCDAIYTLALMVSGLMSPEMTLALLTAEFLVSYTRARAEGLGFELRGKGLMERGERVVSKVIALTVAHFSKVAGGVVCLIILMLTTLTVLQRIFLTKQMIEKKDF
ncbi:MAG: CDP-alcohol phosphatidyltransferase family protein [Thermofilaceae archaeon]